MTSLTEFKENKASFMGRLNSVLTHSEMLGIELTYMLTKDRHQYQTRKELDEKGNRVRYFEHPRRVALIAIDECSVTNPNIIKACLGHDLLEDTTISEALLEMTFGTEPSRWIKQLTKQEGEGEVYYSRLKTKGACEAMFIKLCDRLDNMRTLKDCPPEFQRKQVLDTATHIYPLIGELLYKATNPFLKEQAHLLGTKIRQQVEQVESNLKG